MHIRRKLFPRVDHAVIVLLLLIAIQVESGSVVSDEKSVEKGTLNELRPVAEIRDRRTVKFHSPETKLDRKKRNILQLGRNLIKDTNYSPIKLAHYGNWCGVGGDRGRDGSFIDGCDFCCKKHDKCYHRARMEYPGCSPRLVYYQFSKKDGDSHAHCYNEPSCAKSVCRCDAKFIKCMMKEPCSPLKVYESVNYFWWLFPE